MPNIQLPPKQISCEEFLRVSDHPTVRNALGRYDRGDIDYIEALEICAVALLMELNG